MWMGGWVGQGRQGPQTTTMAWSILRARARRTEVEPLTKRNNAKRGQVLPLPLAVWTAAQAHAYGTADISCHESYGLEVGGFLQG